MEPGTSTEFSSQAARLDLQYLRYANPDAAIQFLFGGGPFAGFDNRSHESFADGVSRTREENDRWEAGVSGLLGVEWFVARKLSLHAEYGFEFAYGKRTASVVDSVSGNISSIDGESTGFGSRSVLLGVSAYF